MFPKNPNDPFYNQFHDPLRAFNNLPGLYKWYLVYPSYRKDEIDHIDYARCLAALHLTKAENERVLISKKALFYSVYNKTV